MEFDSPLTSFVDLYVMLLDELSEIVDGEYIAVKGVLSLTFPLEDLTIADASDSTWLLFCFRDDCELDLDPPNGLIDLDRMPELELWFEDKIELVVILLLKLGSGTVGLEPTLKALKDFPEPVAGKFDVGDGGMLSKSSALPIFSNIARAL